MQLVINPLLMTLLLFVFVDKFYTQVPSLEFEWNMECEIFSSHLYELSTLGGVNNIYFFCEIFFIRLQKISINKNLSTKHCEGVGGS